jgi:putative ABC transport system permease protein
MFADLRHGLRLIGRAPGFAATALATLALGIGANTAIYSAVDATLLRPLPYDDPDRLVMVWEDMSHLGFAANTPAPANYFDWKARNQVFTDMAATRGSTANLTSDGPPEQVIGRRVTANFFDLLGVRPLLGRTFTADDDRTAPPIVVLSYGLWQRRYGGEPSAIGTSIVMSGMTRTIVGVMPPQFSFRGRDVDFWLPAPFTPAETAVRGSHFLNVVARLRDGVTVERAAEDMRSVAAALAREYPDTNNRVGAVVIPVRDDLLGSTRRALIVLMAAAGCVLLIACANLASLLLSRAVARRSELAVRAALGAGWTRLVRQLVAESMVLALAGGLLGLALAPAAMQVVGSLIPPAYPNEAPARIDASLLLFTLGLSLATGLIFSIVPAFQAARVTLTDALQQGGRSASGGRGFARDTLVVAQVAVALVLLVGAGLMIRTLANLNATDLGFRPSGLLTMRTTLPPARYPTEAARLAFYDRVLGRVRELPGVENAAFVSVLPFFSRGNTTGYRIEGIAVEQGQDVVYRTGTPGHLQTLGVALIEGRLPEERDMAAAPPVAVVNETFARMYFGRNSALGHRVQFGGPQAPWRTIVGVVGDVRERGFDLGMKPGAYVPWVQMNNAWTPEQLVVRSSGDPAALAGSIRAIVASVDPAQPVAAVRTMDEVVDEAIVGRRQQATLLGAFAGLALLLASVGLYGVLAYSVTSRRREIGVRLALGATRATVVRTVVVRGLALTVAGLAAGAVLAAMAVRGMQTMLYGVEGGDPATFAAVVGLLAAVALAACAIPAYRAARLDPMAVLRQE